MLICWIDTINPDMLAAISDSDWINENLFVDWLYHIISCAEPTVGELIFILDNHESHVSLACALSPEWNNIDTPSTAYIPS